MQYCVPVTVSSAAGCIARGMSASSCLVRNLPSAPGQLCWSCQPRTAALSGNHRVLPEQLLPLAQHLAYCVRSRLWQTGGHQRFDQ
jgi:hypothetical protein